MLNNRLSCKRGRRCGDQAFDDSFRDLGRGGFGVFAAGEIGDSGHDSQDDDGDKGEAGHLPGTHHEFAFGLGRGRLGRGGDFRVQVVGLPTCFGVRRGRRRGFRLGLRRG